MAAENSSSESALEPGIQRQNRYFRFSTLRYRRGCIHVPARARLCCTKKKRNTLKLCWHAKARQSARGTGAAYVVPGTQRTKFSINTGTKYWSALLTSVAATCTMSSETIALAWGESVLKRPYPLNVFGDAYDHSCYCAR